ncbi:MAG TPA: hypothetical protein VFO40_08785 [Chthoniobacterales bacterium]|nr:hypothetical protein [Chthoniobacterales bacterium]
MKILVVGVGAGRGDGGQSSLLALVMREEVPVDCRKTSQIFL